MADYDFASLSSLDFEILTADLLGAHADLTFESFGPGPDRGIGTQWMEAQLFSVSITQGLVGMVY